MQKSIFYCLSIFTFTIFLKTQMFCLWTRVLFCFAFFPTKIFYFLSFSCKFPLSRSLLKGINFKNTVSTIDNTGNLFPLNNYLTKPLYAWFCCYIFAPFQSKYLSHGNSQYVLLQAGNQLLVGLLLKHENPNLSVLEAVSKINSATYFIS